jgi:hypothetical protein
MDLQQVSVFVLGRSPSAFPLVCGIRRNNDRFDVFTGFVALITVLALIIIISFSAVVFIIRKLRQPTASVGSRQRSVQPDHTPVAFRWKDNVTGAFRIGRWGTRRNRGEHGWMQAGSGDQWDLNLAQENSQPGRRSREAVESRTSKNNSGSSPHQPFRPPTLAYVQPQSSTSSVLELKLPGPLFDFNSYAPITSVNPESSMAASTYTLPRSSSPETLPGTPSKNGDVHTPLNEPDDMQRLWSRSNVSSPTPNTPGRTFHGGSKFIESL